MKLRSVEFGEVPGEKRRLVQEIKKNLWEFLSYLINCFMFKLKGKNLKESAWSDECPGTCFTAYS